MFVPEAYQRPEDQNRARLLREGLFAEFPCSHETTELGMDLSESLPTEQCYKMTKPERMRGTWTVGLENSQFCPASKRCDPDKQTDTWLEFAEPVKMDFDRYEGLYWIDFIGRRTAYPGQYGSYGGWPNDVVVDRIISLKAVESPHKD